eukprot:Skav206415  [mRNA]  locus=scaffold292:290214:292031:- [translate_table: standard]
MIGQNKLFGVLRQQVSSEKRWSLLVDMAKWHGLRTTPEDDTRSRAAQKIQRALRKTWGTKLTSNQFTLCEGFFVGHSGKPLSVLPGIALDDSGVCLMDVQSAMGWLTQKLPIIADELAVITLFNESIPANVPAPAEVSFPAWDGKHRQVLLRGHMWQLGERHARPGPREQEVATSDTMTVAATIWRDSCSESQWEALSKSLVKVAFEHLFDAEMQKVVLQVWGRSYRNDKTRTEPESATSAQFHFRIPRDDAEKILRLSGKSIVWLTPKAESHMSHPDWGLIWFKEFREAEIAAAKSTQHSGFARTRYRYALRVPIKLLDQIAKEVKTTAVGSTIQVHFLYKVQPLPHDIKPEQLVQWAQGFDWKVKLIKKLGRDGALLGSSSRVPFAHLSLNGRPVLVKEISTNKNKNQTSPLLAGPRPAPVKNNRSGDVDTLQEDDPWAPWAAGRARHGHEGGDVENSSSAPSTATRTVDAPTAAKFQAIEQRLATFESNLDALRQTSACQSAAMEATNAVVTDMGNRINQVDSNVQALGSQVANALEGAIARGLEAQEKKMDTKFEQLMGMIANSRKGKRSTPAAAAPSILVGDDDEDQEMESPVKPPATKK